MSRLPMLIHEQMKVLQPLLPRARGLRRVDDRRVISGIIYVIRNGLQWKDAPREFGSYKTLYNRFIRWSKRGVFEKIFATLAARAGVPECLMINSTHLKVHRTAASLRKKGQRPAGSDGHAAA